MTQDLPWLEEELAAHSHWVRRLARSLVHDETAAEDLVQDTWVAALRKPPSDRRALRSWLGRVVRTLAWKQQRKASTAPLSADEGSLPAGASDMELVERLELHRVLAEELRAIREPVRTTLLQRYIEGMSAAEIAERTSVPAPTVRWRLQQGLEELRTRLDARFGGKRDTWMSALAFALPSKGLVLGGAGTALGKSAAALDGSGAALGGSGLAIGEGVLMSTLVKVSLGAALLVAAVMLALPFVTKDEGSVQLAVTKEPAAALAQSGTDEPAVAPAQPDSARVALVESSEPALDKLAPLDAQHTRIVARLLDEDRHPIPGAWLGTGDISYFNLMSGAGRKSPPPPTMERSLADATGLAVCERPSVAAGQLFGLLAGAPGHVAVRVSTLTPAGETGFLGEITLSAAGSISGFVRDENGAPLAGIDVGALRAGAVQRARSSEAGTLVLEPGMMRGERSPQCTSSADGSFSLEGITPGVIRVWGRLEGNRWAHAGPLSLAAGASLQGIEVLAARPPPAQSTKFTLHGVVLQPDGTPLAGARVTVTGGGPGNQTDVESGADGKFEIVTSTRGPFFLWCSSHMAKRVYRDLEKRNVVPGDQVLEFRFAEPRWMHLEVYADGKPAENFIVFTTNAGQRSGENLNHEPGDGPNVGRVMLPDTDFGIRVESEGFVPAELGPFALSSPPERLRIDLHASATVSGHVAAGNKAVNGAEVQLLRVIESGEGSVGGFPTLYEPQFSPALRTDESGRFLLHVSESGKYHLCVRAEGFALSDTGPLSIDASRGVQDLQIALESGGVLEGTVLVAKGRSPAGIIVSMNRGDGSPKSQRVGPDGSFRFERLTPGEWVLARSNREVTQWMATTLGSSKDSKVVFPFNCTVTAGTTTHKDLDLRDVKACTLAGRLSIQGAPAWAWSVTRSTLTGKHVYHGFNGTADLDTGGGFSLELESPGEWTIELHSPVETEASLNLRAKLQLAPGKNTWAFDLPVGRVEGRLNSPHGASIQVRAHPVGLVDAEVSAPIRADSTFELPFVPAGPCEVIESSSGNTEPVVLATFTAVAGQTTHVEIP